MTPERHIYWLLSFSDPARPSGEQWLGCLYLQAETLKGAITTAHAMKLNPGGEVLAIHFSTTTDLTPYAYRLITDPDESANLEIDDIETLPQIVGN